MASLDFDTEVKEFKNFYADNYRLFKSAEESYRTLITLLLAENPDFTAPLVTSRIKERDECVAKFGRKYRAKLEEEKTAYSIKDHITDLIGVRVVCLYYDDIEPIHRILRGNFEIVDVTDRISKIESSDDAFGYKGLHLDLKLKAPRNEQPEYSRFKGLRFEVQIRTIVQDAWSNLDHKIKYKRSIPQKLKRRVNALAALFELADHEFVTIRDETLEMEKQALTGAPSEAAERAPIQPEDDLLDAFKFLRVANSSFEGYPFIAHKVDGFVEELRELNPGITGAELEAAIRDSADILNSYVTYQAEQLGNRLNPFTVIRHALYLSNKDKYGPLLFERSTANFDRWLTELARHGIPPSQSLSTSGSRGSLDASSEQSEERVIHVRDDIRSEQYPLQLQEITATCPECGNNQIHLRVTPGDDEPKVRFCLSCNSRLNIDPGSGEVIKSKRTVPQNARISGVDDGRSILECPQCRTSVKAFFKDATYVYGVCYKCDEPSLLVAENPGRNAPLVLIRSQG